MSATDYFDLSSGRSGGYPGQRADRFISKQKHEAGAIPLFYPPASGAVPAADESRIVSVTLQEVMFTSRVPLSTWTFAFAANDKMFVSDLTTLYFGKRTAFNKKIYHDSICIPERGASLELGITAYNSYGDLFNVSANLRVHASNQLNATGELVTIDEDWTQLLFKFHVVIEQ
jgi:hypothetical protein